MRRKIQKRWDACVRQEQLIRARYQEAYRRSIAEGYNNQVTKESLEQLAAEHGLKIKDGRVK